MSITSILGGNGLSASSVGLNATNAPERSASTRSSSQTDTTLRADQWAADFLKEAKKTPIQRIREEILKRHHLTEAEFAALPTEEQAKILREIEEAVKAALKKQLSKSDPGLVV